MAVGKSVRLFLVDGTPGGLITAEIGNWTGQMLAAPRSDLAALVARPEAFQRTGIYILLGEDPEKPGSQLAYIGESDNVAQRLREHARPEENNGKDFWTRAVLLTSKDANLTKAHAKYLESRLVGIATAAKRARLLNGTTPPIKTLPEADVSDMEGFIEQARVVLPLLGTDLLRSTQVVVPASAAVTPLDSTSGVSPIFRITSVKSNAQATAQEVDGEFTVREGSTARIEWATQDHAYRKLHERVVEEGALPLSPDGNSRVFAKDYVFASPSAAAAVVLGRTSNGRNEWKTDEGQSYGQWQESLLLGTDLMTDAVQAEEF